MDALSLSLFSSRIAAVCDEAGARLQNAAFSPNIRERLDYSCAVFDEQGKLIAQAAHIPVHLGSMAFALRDVVKHFDWRDGDMLVFNAPWLGGTHLPDITVVAPIFVDSRLIGFIANRAHHADIGAKTPGSMPLSESLEEEGLLIEPQYLVRNDEIDWALVERFVSDSCNPNSERGDYAAQISACRLGRERLVELVNASGASEWQSAVRELNAYAARLANQYFSAIPSGEWTFTDTMDDDGLGTADCRIQTTLSVGKDDDGYATIHVDFTGSSPQVKGNINCPLAVTVSAVYYVFRCLLPHYAPSCDGTFSAITVHAPEGLVNAPPMVAVAGGNVETSSRIVDCVLGALASAAPQFCVAASQGTMNNLAMGASQAQTDGTPYQPWSYYETMGGGLGASAHGNGVSATQSHMTNTRNTSAEEIELNYPLRLKSYAVRASSGGAGKHCGGDGLIRCFEFLSPTTVTLLTERRQNAPWGIAGGADGATGKNELNGEPVSGKVSLDVGLGDRLTVMTPGGGGWGGA